MILDKPASSRAWSVDKPSLVHHLSLEVGASPIAQI